MEDWEMEVLVPAFTETKGFLEKVCGLEYPDRDMFFAILLMDEDKINNTLNMYDLLERPYPDWLRAFINAHDEKVGRDMMIEDAIGTYLTLGEF
jgi:hypothetical protein